MLNTLTTTAQNITSIIPEIILLLVMISIFIFCIYMARKTRKLKKVQKMQEKQLKEQGLLTQASLVHVNGLPIPENMPCLIHTYADRIEFHAGTTDITLNRSKITDMSVKTDVEIQKQSVSSAGGAIAGAMMFGVLGAAIGGRAKTKDVRTSSSYLIIAYKDSNDSLKYIGFEATNAVGNAYKMVREFHELNVNSGVKLEL